MTYLIARILCRNQTDALVRTTLIFALNSQNHLNKHERKKPLFRMLITKNVNLPPTICNEVSHLVSQYIDVCSSQNCRPSILDLISLWKDYGVYQREFNYGSDIYDCKTRMTDLTICQSYSYLWNYKYTTILDIITPKPIIYRLFYYCSGIHFSDLFRKALVRCDKSIQQDLRSNYYNIAKLVLRELLSSKK